MAKKIWITFVHGGIIPASVLGAEEDVIVPAQEPIQVPADYGKHLIDDRFAIASSAPEKKEAAKKEDKPARADLEAAESAVAAAKAELDAAQTDAEKETAAEKVKTAEAAVAALKV